MTGLPPDIDGFSLDSLKILVFQLLEENAALRAEVAVLREEIARLKGLKGPPSIKPSGIRPPIRSRRAASARFRAAYVATPAVTLATPFSA